MSIWKRLIWKGVSCVWAGGYGPPLSAGRGTPTQPPSPFSAFLVTTPAGSFTAPQGFPQQGYSAAPQFGQSRPIHPTLNSFNDNRLGKSLFSCWLHLSTHRCHESDYPGGLSVAAVREEPPPYRRCQHDSDTRCFIICCWKTPPEIDSCYPLILLAGGNLSSRLKSPDPIAAADTWVFVCFGLRCVIVW